MYCVFHEYFDQTWLLYVLRYQGHNYFMYCTIKVVVTLCTALSSVFKHEYKVIMMYAVLEGQGGEFVLGAWAVTKSTGFWSPCMEREFEISKVYY